MGPGSRFRLAGTTTVYEAVIASEAKQSTPAKKRWIASSRSLSSGAHSRDPLAPRNDGEYHAGFS
jgi:hypothetical protein